MCTNDNLCSRFLTFDHRQAGEKFYDPKGRHYDRMTQAASSGRKTIIDRERLPWSVLQEKCRVLWPSI